MSRANACVIECWGIDNTSAQQGPQKWCAQLDDSLTPPSARAHGRGATSLPGVAAIPPATLVNCFFQVRRHCHNGIREHRRRHLLECQLFSAADGHSAEMGLATSHFSAQRQETLLGVVRSTLHGSESSLLSCFVDSDVVCRLLVWRSSASTSSCRQPSFGRHAPSTCIRQSACREKEREHFPLQHVVEERHEAGNQPVVDDIRRRPFNLLRELNRCRHRVLGSGDPHAISTRNLSRMFHR